MQSFFIALLSIVWIDLLLSGDNAVVIALVSNRLPEDQQKWGIIGGTAAAILLRVVMSFFAVLLLGVPGLSILGGIFLLKVACSMLAGEEEGGEGDVVGRITLVAAIGTIAAADASMSLDNVLAVAALAHGSVLLMALGVLLSIPLVIAGSAIIAMVIRHLPILTWAGAGLLGWVAGDIIAKDPWSVGLPHVTVAATGVMIVLAFGLYKRVRG
ncbi:YjbE family putative metal transport protein [Bradyrhizobium sp. USDA 4350]